MGIRDVVDGGPHAAADGRSAARVCAHRHGLRDRTDRRDSQALSTVAAHVDLPRAALGERVQHRRRSGRNGRRDCDARRDPRTCLGAAPRRRDHRIHDLLPLRDVREVRQVEHARALELRRGIAARAARLARSIAPIVLPADSLVAWLRDDARCDPRHDDLAVSVFLAGVA